MAAGKDVVALLEETRALIERALAHDENWRALIHSRDGETSEDAAHLKARDARLEMALKDNAAYRAWQYVGRAIDAMSDGEHPPHGADAAKPASPELRQAGADELPRDIADRLRSRSAEEARFAREREKRLAAPLVPPAPPSAAREGAETRPTARAAEEAEVTFVTTEPLIGAARGSGRRPRLRERLSELGQSAVQARAFSAPKGGGEEADVRIFSGDAIGIERLAQQRKSAIARFRKALLGE